MTVVTVFICGSTFASCGGDDDDDITPPTIWGSYSGTVTVNITDKSNSSVTNYSTEARLTLAKKNGKMSYEVVSTGDKAFEQSTELPLLNVSGDKNYHYSYTSNDGKTQTVIDSPDYINITVSDHAEDDDYIFEFLFVGKRI